MGKKTGVFTDGQHVFAKVKGYSPWPAKITKVIAKHRYAVYFYGTGETASVKSEDLDPYDKKNIVRFNTDRQLKKNDYKEAVDQIQSAIDGNDPAPIVTDDKKLKNNNDLELKADNITDNDNSADESQLLIAEDVVTKSTPQTSKKKAAELKVIQEFTPLEPEAKENDEKVSRSGRKIKEKKMNTDEMHPDEMFMQPRKRLKIEDGAKQKPVVVNPETNAIDEFRASKMHVLLDPVKKHLLECQYEMIHIMQDIKCALGLDNVDIDLSITLLEKFKDKILPHITNLMLLKYPNTVDTVKRLRKYIGNLPKWSLEESQVEQFTEKSEKIRSTATEVYDAFRTLFNFGDAVSFWGKFAAEKDEFKEKYSTLDHSDLFEGLSIEELDSFVNNQLTGDDDNNDETKTNTPTKLEQVVESEQPLEEPMKAADEAELEI